MLSKLCSVSPCKLAGGSKAFCVFVRNLVHGHQVELDQDVLDRVLYVLVGQLRAPEPASGTLERVLSERIVCKYRHIRTCAERVYRL